MSTLIGGQSAHPTRRVWFVVGTVIIIHAVCYKASLPLKHALSRPVASDSNLNSTWDGGLMPGIVRRAMKDTDTGREDTWMNVMRTGEEEGKEEGKEEGEALIDYNGIYHRASPSSRPFIFAALILWLSFLFVFVGITASDFFCPNLSTIANRLGMSENVAGVTFLAFSNGSPDVFSTFAALRSGSGALAFGELIGAASFIVSVVA